MLLLKCLKWQKIINDWKGSQETPITFYFCLSLPAFLHFCNFFYLSKTACLSDYLTNCVFILFPLLAWQVCQSVHLYFSLPFLQVNENGVKLGEDVWWITENSCCMTPPVRLGQRAVSWPVHCLAFVYDISSVLRGFIVQRWFTRLTTLPLPPKVTTTAR